MSLTVIWTGEQKWTHKQKMGQYFVIFPLIIAPDFSSSLSLIAVVFTDEVSI